MGTEIQEKGKIIGWTEEGEGRKKRGLEKREKGQRLSENGRRREGETKEESMV